MKIALVQMSMGKEISENLDKSLKYCDMAENFWSFFRKYS